MNHTSPGPLLGGRLPRELRALLTALVSLGLLALALAAVDLQEAWRLVRQTRPGPFLLAVALGPLQIGLSAVRWRLVSARLGTPLPLRMAGQEYALGTVLNMVLPGGIGGDALRTWRYHRRMAVPGGAAVQATLIERGAGQAVLIAITLAGLLAWPMLLPGIERPPGVLTVVIALAVAAASLALWPSTFGERIRCALLGRSVLLPQLLLSVVIVASYIGGFALCALALSAAPWPAALTTIPLILLAMALPISVGGWGLRETAAIALLPRLGWSSEAALTVSGLYGLSALFGALIGALLLSRPAAA